MARWLAAAGAAGIVALIGLVAPRPIAAEACQREMPSSVQNVLGFTFTGVLSAIDQVDTPGVGIRGRWTFEVDHVYAGADVRYPDGTRLVKGHSITFDEFCAPLMQVATGRRYLVSKADLFEWTSPTTVAWELLAHDRVRLVREYDSSNMDPRFAQPTTLQEALALVAPDARVPDTDALGPTEGREFPMLPVAFLAGIAWLVLQFARHRTSLSVRQGRKRSRLSR
jgi:hypothetical protein